MVTVGAAMTFVAFHEEHEGLGARDVVFADGAAPGTTDVVAADGIEVRVLDPASRRLVSAGAAVTSDDCIVAVLVLPAPVSVAVQLPDRVSVQSIVSVNVTYIPVSEGLLVSWGSPTTVTVVRVVRKDAVALSDVAVELAVAGGGSVIVVDVVPDGETVIDGGSPSFSVLLIAVNDEGVSAERMECKLVSTAKTTVETLVPEFVTSHVVKGFGRVVVGAVRVMVESSSVNSSMEGAWEGGGAKSCTVFVWSAGRETGVTCCNTAVSVSVGG